MAKKTRLSRLAEQLSYPLEAALAGAFFAVFARLSVDRASALGGWVGRQVGPLLPMTAYARANLEAAFPDMPTAERRRIVRGMWDNLGRIFAEYAHLHRLKPDMPDGRVEVIGQDHLLDLRAQGRSFIVVGAHIGNWELGPVVLAHYDPRFTFIYRHANNPAVDRMLASVRTRAAPGTFTNKGPSAGKTLAGALRSGRPVAMLADQRLRGGIEIPLLGLAARTTPAPGMLSRGYKAPIVMLRVERLTGARFRITIDPPFTVEPTGDAKADVRAIAMRIHGVYERWIHDHPEQWLWLHRRWR